MKTSIHIPHYFHEFHTIIDVRTPAEYAIDHIPGALNFPILSNEERVIIGTLYTTSPFEAKRKGAALVAKNLATILEQHCNAYPKQWKPLIYCWRGGMRSGSVVECFKMIGWHAYQLPGGYKQWRKELLERLETLPQAFSFHVISGHTGSGKTAVLHHLASKGEQVLDLEGLAEHKGSVLGQLNEKHQQPSQKQFENRIAHRLASFQTDRPVWVEAESKKIGGLHIPNTLMDCMRAGTVFTIDTPLTSRVAYILEDYQWFFAHPLILLERLSRLQPFISKATWEQWNTWVSEKAWESLVTNIIAEHYDPLYSKAQAKNYFLIPPQSIPLQAITKTALEEAATLLLQKQ